MRNNAMDAYAEQTDVDRAFADYDAAQLIAQPHPMLAARRNISCGVCGSVDYTYNGGGTCDAGARVCSTCGVVASGNIIYEQMFGRLVSTRTSNYKRIHHWHERISQLMLMESQILPEHMVLIGEKLLDGSHTIMSKDSIRSVLRSLGLQVYIEKWLQIIQRCTGIVPPCPGPIVLQRLDELFIELQRPFRACKLQGRRNFLNYNYVFCRLFQLMDCHKFCMFFPLIRSKAKLTSLDTMWTAMAQSVGWEVPPLQQVLPFSVRIEQPETLLERLKQQCAHLTPAEPQTALVQKATRMWDQWTREVRGRAAPAQLRPRSERSERTPQTLALRLKRKRSLPAS